MRRYTDKEDERAMRRIFSTLLIVGGVLGAAWALAWSGSASADDGWGGWYGRGYRTHPEMMHGIERHGSWLSVRAGHERPLISMMLKWKEQLGLTADQERALRELRAGFEKDAIRGTSEIEVAELELKGLLEREPVELAAVEAQARKAALLRADLRVSRIKTIEAGKAVLTPEQRSKLERLGHGRWWRGLAMEMMLPWMDWIPARSR
jgi:Spy/CpxP family protein refolding chaperone